MPGLQSMMRHGVVAAMATFALTMAVKPRSTPAGEFLETLLVLVGMSAIVFAGTVAESGRPQAPETPTSKRGPGVAWAATAWTMAGAGMAAIGWDYPGAGALTLDAATIAAVGGAAITIDTQLRRMETDRAAERATEGTDGNEDRGPGNDQR